ncbi:MAG: carbohydrate-binding protein [Lachnospiraceae bacterium]
MEFCLKILNKEMQTKAVSHGEQEAFLVYSQQYQEGDQIVLEISEKNRFVWFSVDDAKGKSLIFLTGSIFYRIPFGKNRINISPKVFHGEKHLIYVREARDFEVTAYYNLAENVCDQHNIENMYPHVTANVETRDEAVFAAHNATDGIFANTSHGEWPYESWGINQRKDAKLRIEYGRVVVIDRVILRIRADFPHDSWWENAKISFSDYSVQVISLTKTKDLQELTFAAIETEWIEFHDLEKAEDASPFPALVQIETYGRNKL